jgi:hypothetical protein
MSPVSLALLLYQQTSPTNGLLVLGALVGVGAGALGTSISRDGSDRGERRAAIGSGWAALAGIAVFTLVRIATSPYPLAYSIDTAFAVEGAVWCGLFGLVGVAVMRKRMRAGATGTHETQSSAVPPKRFPIRGLPDGEQAWIANFGSADRANWRILGARYGVAGEWTGSYATPEEALNEFQKQYDTTNALPAALYSAATAGSELPQEAASMTASATSPVTSREVSATSETDAPSEKPKLNIGRLVFVVIIVIFFFDALKYCAPTRLPN